MKANYILPIASVQGKIAHGYYARILHGKTIIQRCPVRTKPATPAQRKAQHEFVTRYATTKDHSHHSISLAFRYHTITTPLPLRS